jgi:hypothetical protein
MLLGMVARVINQQGCTAAPGDCTKGDPARLERAGKGQASIPTKAMSLGHAVAF